MHQLSSATVPLFSPGRLGRIWNALATHRWTPFAAVAIAFGIDALTPRAVADALFYLLAVIACLDAPSPRVPLRVAGWCTPLIILGYFVSPPSGAPLSLSLVNRVLALITVWVGALVIAQRLKGSARAREIERSREKLLRLIEASTDFISISDLTGYITYMNPHARGMVGVEQEGGFRGLHGSDYVPDSWRRFFDETVLPTIRDNGKWEGEMQLRHLRTGELIDVFRRSFVIRDPQTGEPEAFATVSHDITQLKRDQIKVRDNEVRLRLALEAARAGVFDWNIETNEVQWSQGVFDLLGLVPGVHAPSYAQWRRSVHPEDIERVEAALQSSIRSGERLVCEYRIVREDAAVLWVQAQGLTIPHAGRADRMIGAIIDITKVKDAEAAAWSSERRFRLMADGVPAIIWVTNVRGEMEFVNREYHKFFGLDVEQVPPDGWRTLMHPEDFRTYEAAYMTALVNREPFHSRARVRHASGQWRWIESWGAPRFSETGSFLGHVGLSPDVTEIVESQQALQEADRRKDEFLAMLSHELRNPLAPIRSAAEILGATQLTPEKLQWAQAVIRRQTRHMAELLDDLLDLARVTQGKLELRMQPVAVASVVDAALEAVRPLLDRKGHRLTVSLPAEPAFLNADPLRLSQVLTNLLTNAAKYTDPGGNIKLTARIQGGMLSLSVKDDGVGLSAEGLTRIFTMFSQVTDTSSRAEGGLGIGLALARGLVELHGGTIEARSEGLGRGCEFVVRLPLGKTHSTALQAPAARESAETSTASLRVLVVDDNADAADSLAILLTLGGHQVRAAYNGLTALALAQTFHPQAVLLDIGMPDLDGYMVAQSLRAEPWATDIFLVALTGWAQEEDKRRARSAGFDAHLTKPVDPDQVKALLLEASERAVRGSSAQKLQEHR